jgi:hypothetical protein
LFVMSKRREQNYILFQRWFFYESYCDRRVSYVLEDNF